MYYETEAAFDQHRRDLEAGYILTYDPDFDPAENGMEGEMTVMMSHEVSELPYALDIESLEQQIRLELASEFHEIAIGVQISHASEQVLQAVEEALDEAKAELEELEIEHPKFSAAIHDYVAVELQKRLETGADEFHAKLMEIIVIGDIVRDLQAELSIEEGGYDQIAEEMMHFADAMRDKAFVDAELLIVRSGELTRVDVEPEVSDELPDLEIVFEAPEAKKSPEELVLVA